MLKPIRMLSSLMLVVTGNSAASTLLLQQQQKQQRVLQPRKGQGENLRGAIYTATYIPPECPHPVPTTYRFQCGAGATIVALDDGPGKGTSFCRPATDDDSALECNGSYVTIMCVGSTVEQWQAAVMMPGLDCPGSGDSHAVSIASVCRNAVHVEKVFIPEERVYCNGMTIDTGFTGGIFCSYQCGLGFDNDCEGLAELIMGAVMDDFTEECLWDPDFTTSITDVTTQTPLLDENNVPETFRLLYLVNHVYYRHTELCQLETASLMLRCGGGGRIDLVDIEEHLSDTGCVRQSNSVMQCSLDTTIEANLLSGNVMAVSCQGPNREDIAIEGEYIPGNERATCRSNPTDENEISVVYSLDILQYCKDAPPLYERFVEFPYDKAPDWTAQKCWPFLGGHRSDVVVDFYDEDEDGVVDSDEEIFERPGETCGWTLFNCVDPFQEYMNVCDENGSRPAPPVRVFIRAEDVVFDRQCVLPLVLGTPSSIDTTPEFSLPPAGSPPSDDSVPTETTQPAETPPLPSPASVVSASSSQPSQAALSLTQQPSAATTTNNETLAAPSVSNDTSATAPPTGSLPLVSSPTPQQPTDGSVNASSSSPSSTIMMAPSTASGISSTPTAVPSSRRTPTSSVDDSLPPAEDGSTLGIPAAAAEEDASDSVRSMVVPSTLLLGLVLVWISLVV